MKLKNKPVKIEQKMSCSMMDKEDMTNNKNNVDNNNKETESKFVGSNLGKKQLFELIHMLLTVMFALYCI